ncbi:MAG: ester cyclase [Bacteroidota bacterium]
MKFAFPFLLLLIMTLISACGDHEAHHDQIEKEIVDLQNQEKEALKATVQKFYDALSTAPTDESVADMATWMDEKWNSTPTPAGGADREGFVKTLYMFHGMIPDLNWDVKDMHVDGNTVTVRSIATGTPNSPEGYFFGTPTDGSKKFEIMTIDVHRLVDGKFTTSFHVEDWLTAVQQVAPASE